MFVAIVFGLESRTFFWQSHVIIPKCSEGAGGATSLGIIPKNTDFFTASLGLTVIYPFFLDASPILQDEKSLNFHVFIRMWQSLQQNKICNSVKEYSRETTLKII